MPKKLFLLIGLFSMSGLLAQESILLPVVIEDGDTIPIIYLRTVRIVAPRIFKSRRHYRRFTRLQRDVRKVYPYAVKAGMILRAIDKEMADANTRRERKKYLRVLEHQLKEEFQEKLVNLTVNQGRILIKLIDRETQRTCYYIVKDLKGSFSAFFWHSIANIFGSSLKYQYDPHQERAIESIIQSIENPI